MQIRMKEFNILLAIDFVIYLWLKVATILV